MPQLGLSNGYDTVNHRVSSSLADESIQITADFHAESALFVAVKRYDVRTLGLGTAVPTKLSDFRLSFSVLTYNRSILSLERVGRSGGSLSALVFC